MTTTTPRKPCPHPTSDPSCASCLLFGADDEFRAAWGGPALPRAPNHHVQILVDAWGIGDAVLGLTACHGLKLDRPESHIAYVCRTPRQEAWCRLFGGYDELTTHQRPRTRFFRPHTGDAEQCRGKPRWEHYGEAVGAKCVLPPVRPLPADVMPWAWPYRGAVVLCPGTASDPGRRWPLPRWHDLARRCRCVAIDDNGARVARFPEKVAGERPGRVAALMLGAAVVVSNDSGMAHVAGAMGVPTLVLGDHRPAHGVFGLYPTVAGLQRPLRDLTPEEVWPHVAARIGILNSDFNVSPYLHPEDPWLASESADSVKRIYADKHRLAALLQPRRILEIGVRAGYSAAAFLSACPDAVYLGIDADDTDEHGGWPGAAAKARDMLGRHFPGRAEVRVADTASLESLPAGQWDLIHVDGAHDFDGALRDLRLARKAGPRYVLVDDVDYCPPVGLACRQWLGESGWRAVTLPTLRGDLLAASSFR